MVDGKDESPKVTGPGPLALHEEVTVTRPLKRSKSSLKPFEKQWVVTIRVLYHFVFAKGFLVEVRNGSQIVSLEEVEVIGGVKSVQVYAYFF